MIIPKTCTPEALFSSDHFSVTYRLFGSKQEARARAEAIYIEIMEFPTPMQVSWGIFPLSYIKRNKIVN
jgi:hypothetical protein